MEVIVDLLKDRVEVDDTQKREIETLNQAKINKEESETSWLI